MKIRNFTIRSLLFDNLTIRQTIFKNIFWLALAEGVSKLMKLILLIYVARILGAHEYGKFTFAIAFVTLFIVFAKLGLHNIVTREFSREKEREAEFSSILSLKILLSLGAFILIFFGSYFVTPDPGIQKIIWILAVFTLVSSFGGIFHAFLRARQRMEYESFLKIFEAVAITGLGLFVILNFPSAENLSYSYLLAGFITLIFLLAIFHFKIQPLKIEWKTVIWRKFLAMSWPLGLAGMIGIIYTQIDSVMMGYLNQITQTGWYNAAYRIVGVALIPVGLISLSFYPALSRAFGESKQALQKIWDYEVKIILILVFPLVAGGLILAPRIINTIYGSAFSSAILAFQILIIMAGILFLQEPLRKLLVICNQQKRIFWMALSGAIINIGLNLILIPRYSLYGAAAARVVTQFIVFLILLIFFIKFTPITWANRAFLKTILWAGISTFVMISVIEQLQLNIFLVVSIAALIYFLTFLFLTFLFQKYEFASWWKISL